APRDNIRASPPRRSAGEPEYLALIGPRTRNALQQPPDGQGTGLAPLHDGFNDIRGQIPEPQQPADMRVVELEVPGNLIGVVVCPITKALHPPLRARDCKDQPMIDPSRGWLTGNNDLLSRTRLWRRQLRSIDLWCIAVAVRLAGP